MAKFCARLIPPFLSLCNLANVCEPTCISTGAMTSLAWRPPFFNQGSDLNELITRSPIVLPPSSP